MKSVADSKKPNSSFNSKKELASVNKYIKKFDEAGIIALAKLNKYERIMILSWAQGVVAEYGAHINENPIKIKNVVELPFSKENIKIAIKTMLPAYMAKESNDNINFLKNLYIRLSEFQEIRQGDIDDLYREIDQINQNTKLTDPSRFPVYHRYIQLMVAEHKILIDEIDGPISEYQKQHKRF